MTRTRTLIMPHFSGTDLGDGGIRRIVEAQYRYLPVHGFDIVDEPPYDLLVVHAGDWPRHVVNAGVPVVAHCHGLYWSEFQWGLAAEAVNNAVVHNMLRADAVITCSEFVARAIRKALWIDPHVIYHGVDAEEWDSVDITPFEGQGYVLWNKARVDAICDPEPVYKLAHMLPDVRFVTTYTPPALPPLDNVAVVGKVPYTTSKIITKSADIYLGVTRGTFDISVVEAMLCGVPVLGWNWGALPEAVMHKVHGYLAAPGDYTDLAKGYHWIQRNRDTVGAAAAKRAEQMFLWPNLVEQYAQVYKRVAV